MFCLKELIKSRGKDCEILNALVRVVLILRISFYNLSKNVFVLIVTFEVESINIGNF